ncbi:MAG: hypothetical protein Q4A16_03875 [Lautropia sp.]|nr:hypothetical protein [Lautropia sp.]
MSGIQVHKVPALHGWHWLRQGFELLKRAPMQLLLLVIVLKTLTNLLPAFGMLGLMAAKIIMPALIVGFLSVVRELAPDPMYPGAARPTTTALPGTGRTTAPPRFSLESFIGWARNRQALQTVLLIGMLGLLIDFAALYLSDFQTVIEKMAATVNASAGTFPADEAALEQMLAPLMRSFTVFLAITLPCYLFLWYAPVFGGLHRLPLLKSIVFSIVAVKRNLLAFLCYAIALAILMISFGLLTQVFGQLLGGGGGAFGLQSLLLFLLIPLLLAVVGCSQWACYLDTIGVDLHNGTSALPPSDSAD